MSSQFRSLVTGGLMGLLVVIALVNFTQAESPRERTANLRKAALAAIHGPDAKLKIGAHDFIVKKATIAERDGIVVIRGTISHQLSLRPDDQLYYTIHKTGEKIVSVDIRVSRGGLAPVTGYMIGDVLGLKHAGLVADSFLTQLGTKFDGDWESMAKLAVASVALRAPSSRAELRDGGKAYQPKSSK